MTIAYLGGSITQGVGAKPESTKCYAYLSAQIFARKYAKDISKVNYVNAGIAGTPSLLGLTRCNKDIIEQTPDIVFIEFAVNDGTDLESRDVYESLVRKLIKSESSPAVVLIFNVTSGGYSAQDNMQKTGEYYDLGMISIRDAITPEIKAGRMKFIGEYAVDEAHPSNFGHELIADCIEYYFDSAQKKQSSEYRIPDNVNYKATYEDLRNINADSEFISSSGDFKHGSLNCFTYTSGWTHDNGGKNSPMVIDMAFSHMIISYKQENSSSKGSACVYVDGQKIATLYGYSSGGWGNIVTEIVYRSDLSAKHKVEIKMSDEDASKGFTLLGIGYIP